MQLFQKRVRVRQSILLSAAALGVCFGGAQRLTGQESTKSKKTTKSTARVKLSNEDVADRMMYGTVWIHAIKSGRVAWYGTGWLLDAKRRLIITNHHVVNESKNNDRPADELRVFFAVKKNGYWVKDKKYYFANVKPSKGTVITSSRKHEVALVQLDRIPSTARALPLASRSARQASQIHTMGGSPRGSQLVWIYASGRVRAIGNRVHALKEITRVIESTLAANSGNSGGPVLNDYGEVVGVVEGSVGGGATNVSIQIDIMALKTFLREALLLVSPKSAVAYTRRADLHRLNKRYSQTLSDCAAAIRLDPKYALAYSVRARVHLARGNTKTALADCREALRVDAKLADAHYVRGLTNYKLKKYEDSIRDYSSAIELRPTKGRYYHYRSRANFAAGDKKSSYNDAKNATKYSAKVPLYWSNRGRVAREISEYSDSLSSFSTAFKLLPLPKYLNSRGVTYLKLKKNSDAAKDFTAAILLHRLRYKKDNAIYFYNKAIVSRIEKKYSRANSEVSIAIRLSPKYAKAYYLRGLCQRDMGRADLAAKDFALAKKYDPKAYGKLKITQPRKSRSRSGKRTRTSR